MIPSAKHSYRDESLQAGGRKTRHCYERVTSVCESDIKSSCNQPVDTFAHLFLVGPSADYIDLRATVRQCALL